MPAGSDQAGRQEAHKKRRARGEVGPGLRPASAGEKGLRSPDAAKGRVIDPPYLRSAVVAGRGDGLCGNGIFSRLSREIALAIIGCMMLDQHPAITSPRSSGCRPLLG